LLDSLLQETNIKMTLRTLLCRLGSNVVLKSSSVPRFQTSGPLSLVPNNLHTSVQRFDLNEFFEPEKVRGDSAVRVGRAWKHDELRLKSNTDLHKLWYVLLKERNMLLTMAEAYKAEMVPMPNPERLDKVEESMENLEEVVRERNRAFYNLEVGWHGERDRVYRKDCFGQEVPYKPVEHQMPFIMNSGYRKKLNHRFLNPRNSITVDFMRRMKEREKMKDSWMKNNEMREAARVVRRFPEVDLEALQDRFPSVDPGKLMRWIRVKGPNDHPHNVHSDHPPLGV